MVAIIKTGHSIHNILNYNENKVKAGVAECIGEGNYPVDADRMSFTMKQNRLVRQAALNDNVKRNSVHISLNFDPSEKDLSKDKLMEIANSYMDKIGFGEQPYLVYQHHDAGHPHIHLVSIKIRQDGRRIDTQNIGRNQSEKARKEIEQAFGLVAAQGRSKKEEYELKPITMGKIRYGRIESKKALTTILDGVLPVYKYTSLAELNAVLKLYNVLADRGNENSRIFKGMGLVYRILDDDGKPVGVPVKASDFYNRPTLKKLETLFIENQGSRLNHRTRLRTEIDRALLGTNGLSIQRLHDLLEKEGISMVLRYSDQKVLYGITYVDHKTKCVFNGSILGKQYSAKAILNRCSTENAIDRNKEKVHSTANQVTGNDIINTSSPATADLIDKITETLMQPEQPMDYLPNQLKGKKKKKKRKGSSDNH